MNTPLRIALLIAAATLAACAGLASDEGSATVTGKAMYPPQGAVPPNSTLRVQLLDVSRQDARAVLISETTISLEGKQPPIGFRLAYRREAIKVSNTYSVRASIIVGNRMAFTTTETYPVLTHGAPADVSVRLHSVRASGTEPAR